MTSPYISSASAYSLLQTSVKNIRTNLSKAQAELSSGSPADYGLDLGSKTNLLVGMQQQQTVLTQISQNNAIATTRLDATTTALNSLMTSASNFMQLMIQNKPNQLNIAALQSAAKEGLSAMRDIMNTTVAGSSIFGGENTQAPVIANDPNAAGGPADTAFQSAFGTTFGMATNSATVDQITSGQMSTFLSGNFASLFDATGWKASYSAAGDQGISTQITASRVTTTSISGNDPAFSTMAKAFATIADLPLAQMGSDAANIAISKAAETASNALAGLTALQAQVGTMQQTVKDATQSLSVQIDTFTKGIEALDPVDPYAVSTQVTQLTTQLQTSYTLTAQLQHLSLAQYL